MILKFAVNISLLFTEVPFSERFDKAASYGYKAVEFYFPYDNDVDEIKYLLDNLKLKLVLFNLHPGDMDKNEWGTLSNPNRQEYFRWSLMSALNIADKLNCSQINVMFGNKILGLTEETQIECALDNLVWATKEVQKNNIDLLIEALNPCDFPSCFLQNPTDAIRIVQKMNHPNVKLLYDVYHAQMMQGNLINSIKKFYPYISHIQIADVPGRHEPGTGEINFSSIFKTLIQMGYKRFIGLEYIPSNNRTTSMEWFNSYQRF